MPLVVGGNVTGLLAVVRPHGDDDDAERFADDEWLLSALADQTAAPVENAQLTEQLERARSCSRRTRALYEAERAARKEAELARAEAESANRAKSEFLANMSHELRTPLNAIAGYVELLDMEIRGPITPAQREDLARIKASQRVLLRLVNDVLNFAKLESGHVPVDVEGRATSARCSGRSSRSCCRSSWRRGCSFERDRAPTSCDAICGSGEARADSAQPALERDQVHAARGLDPAHVRGGGRHR